MRSESSLVLGHGVKARSRKKGHNRTNIVHSPLLTGQPENLKRGGGHTELDSCLVSSNPSSDRRLVENVEAN